MPEPLVEQAAAIEQRLGAWRWTGDIAALWPDLAPDDWISALRRIAALTARILRGQEPTRLEDHEGTRALGVAAFIAGMGPLIGWWIEAGMVDASASTSSLFAKHLAHGRRRIERLHDELTRILVALQAEGVSPVLIKGLHTGIEYLPHPATRPAADIDLLVRPSERAVVATVLSEHGFLESVRTRFAMRSEWVRAGAPRAVRSLELDHADNPWSLDVVLAADRWYFRGTRRSLGDEVFSTQRSLTVGDQTVRVLDQPYLTGFLALHSSRELDRMQLIRLVELAIVMRTDGSSGRLDWKELRDLFDRSDTWRFVYPALELTNQIAPDVILPEVIERARQASTARLRRLVGAISGRGMGPVSVRSLDYKLAFAATAKETVMNVLDLLVPADEASGGLRRVYARRLQLLSHYLRLRGARVGPPPRSARNA